MTKEDYLHLIKEAKTLYRVAIANPNMDEPTKIKLLKRVIDRQGELLDASIQYLPDEGEI